MMEENPGRFFSVTMVKLLKALLLLDRVQMDAWTPIEGAQ